jgi:hypothetical protein
MRTLEQQRQEYRQRRFIAMPLAGTLAWAAVALASLVLPESAMAIVLFSATGSIFFFGILISKLTGEDFLDKSRPKNAFDGQFMATVFMALLVYAIAIPFFLIEYTSLPMTIGILTGLMWLPLSWAIQHWVGYFHAIARTVSIVALWYLFPEQRFLAIPLAIVVVYLITIFALEARWKEGRTLHAPSFG